MTVGLLDIQILKLCKAQCRPDFTEEVRRCDRGNGCIIYLCYQVAWLVSDGYTWTCIGSACLAPSPCNSSASSGAIDNPRVRTPSEGSADLEDPHIMVSAFMAKTIARWYIDYEFKIMMIVRRGCVSLPHRCYVQQGGERRARELRQQAPSSRVDHRASIRHPAMMFSQL